MRPEDGPLSGTHLAAVILCGLLIGAGLSTFVVTSRSTASCDGSSPSTLIPTESDRCQPASSDDGDLARSVGAQAATVGGSRSLFVAALLALGIGATAMLGGRVIYHSFRRPDIRVVDREPESILSDADRIVLLLERHDGRMRQRHIVEQVEWSKAKVSRLLSDLETQGVIRKLRLGRENLIYLEGRDPFGDSDKATALDEE